jgi:hypothetical protein
MKYQWTSEVDASYTQTCGDATTIRSTHYFRISPSLGTKSNSVLDVQSINFLKLRKAILLR